MFASLASGAIAPLAEYSRVAAWLRGDPVALRDVAPAMAETLPGAGSIELLPIWRSWS